MAIEVTTCASFDDVIAALAPVWHYFGGGPIAAADSDRFQHYLEPRRVFAAREGGAGSGAALRSRSS